MSEAPRRLCFVLSAPSGAGKTSLARAVLGRVEKLTRTVSCTTRTARAEEVDGTDYYFIDADRFERMRRAGEFLEWAKVHGNLYGTPRAEIERIQSAGHDAILVIDVQGADSVRQAMGESVTIFVLPPSRGALEARLTDRDGDSLPEAQRKLRLGEAAHEIAQYVSYDYLILNEDFEIATAELEGVVRAERSRRRRRARQAEAVLASFTDDVADRERQAGDS